MLNSDTDISISIALPVRTIEASQPVRDRYTPTELMRLAGLFMARETTELVISDGANKLGLLLNRSSGTLSIFTVRISYAIYEDADCDVYVQPRYSGYLTMNSLGDQPQNGQYWVASIGQSYGQTVEECLRHVQETALLHISGAHYRDGDEL